MSNIINKVKDKMDNSGSGGNASITQGSKLPQAGPLKEDNPEKGSVDLATLKGKNLIVAVPGAFSSACSNQVPGFIENAEKFASKGVQGIYVVAVNDVFVMQAWKKDMKGDQNPMFHFLADDDASFSKSAGMAFDATGLLGSHRSNRYVAVIEDGTVKQVFEEEKPTDVKITSADAVLQAIA